MSVTAKLSLLKPGEKGEITALIGEKELKSRLAAMGFRRGAKVAVSHSSLFGDPRTYMVAGTQISLRKTEADQVQVTVMG